MAETEAAVVDGVEGGAAGEYQQQEIDVPNTDTTSPTETETEAIHVLSAQLTDIDGDALLPT